MIGSDDLFYSVIENNQDERLISAKAFLLPRKLAPEMKPRLAVSLSALTDPKRVRRSEASYR